MSNDFLPFATGGGANVIDQATYATAASTSAGFSAGIADSQYLNKVWRQSSFIAAAIAQYVANTLSINVNDDGNLSEFVTHLTAALAGLSGGLANEIPYQSAPNTTAFISAPTEPSSLTYNGSNFLWSPIAASFGTNGYVIFSNGFIAQWGNYTAGTTDTAYTVSLPISFPNNHLQAYSSVATSGSVAGCWTSYAIPGSLSTVILTADVQSGSASNVPLSFLCIGN